jgi:hypothetical protein
VVVATANHYVLDLAAGCLLAVAATYLTALRVSGGLLVGAELPRAATAGGVRILARQGNEENHVR